MMKSFRFVFFYDAFCLCDHALLQNTSKYYNNIDHVNDAIVHDSIYTSTLKKKRKTDTLDTCYQTRREKDEQSSSSFEQQYECQR